MKNMTTYGFGLPATGVSVPGTVGTSAWRVRPILVAKSARSGLLVTDVPATKPNVSASERCP